MNVPSTESSQFSQEGIFPPLLDNGTLANFYNFIPYFSIAILFVCCFYIFERHLLHNNNKPFPKHYVYQLIALGFTIRVFLSYYGYDYIDILIAEEFAELAYLGEDDTGRAANVYTYGRAHPYAPFWILWLLLFKYLSIITGLPFVILFKYLGILTDTFFMFFVLYFLLKNLIERQNMSLLLALSPVVISVSAVFGQFDIIPTFFSFLAFLVLVHNDKNWKWAALCLGFGIYAKTFPIILLPAFLSQFSSIKRRISFSCIAITPVTLSLMIAATINCTPQDILNNIFFHQGVVGGAYGISGLLWVVGQVFQFVGHNSYGYEILQTLWSLYNNYGIWMIIVSLGIGYFFLFKKASLLERIIYTYLVFYVFSYAVACQYLVWILPFLYYGKFTFASGFHFWSNLAIFVYIPFTVGGIFSFQTVDKLFPLVVGFLWLYSLYCLVLITRNIWEKRNDTHKVAIH